MPAIVYANEYAFQQFMLNALDPGVVEDLGINATHLLVAAQDALLDYPADDWADATDLRRIRAFGKWRAWERVAAMYVAQFRSVTEGQTFESQQKFDHAVKMRDAARAEIDTMLRLELVATEAAGSFDWAEQVLTSFNGRERIADEYQRGSF